ncbi:two-partner secretion domain-containing protein [Noviherbaspirillum aridicola]|uniref:Filamentous haemagglutinin FhaB/tRNA nuclease CdiA-like TPS domain-containing protein n=1 Tax=Noviherbaspirillum aridicola TaxID=2849687 RepID=A0ABQ4Q339_9BURK|nr:filamentous hemagglutinin N-terminal domain-containing protein [Noviherbaspirillum aridicola]GIZ51427.1 hypothetical protein NCCP691_14410 [Noviherbaspirillum aridicola]
MKTRTRASSLRKAPALRCRLLPLLIAGCFSPAAWANPQGAQVVNGQVGFQQQGGVLSVTNTPGSIINWQSFSINPGETTRFIQQSAASAVLNRVVGQDPSKILGTLQSNGKVFLINPNGILFGQGARIDVNGLIASTLNLSNEDFLRGKMNFTATGSAGAISNQGTIVTPSGGQVYLVAPNIENSGIIHSPKGDVLLAAGHTVQLVDSSNPNLQVVVSAPENQALNLGQIITEGGRTGIYGALIKQRGVVNADSAVVGENGKIVFKASRDTLLEAGSVTSATGAGKGGDIQVLGDRVGLMADARVDASGRTGGGTVLVGGDYKGGNAQVQNAKRTYVSADASIRADAVNEGDGGKVIVWGDETTRVHGSISARGGAALGNGGFIETSGGKLDIQGVRIDTRAPRGKFGQWLIDPTNIRVADTAATDPNFSYIRPADLSGAQSDVQLVAPNDIEFLSPVALVNPGIGLTADAGHDIRVRANISTSGGDVRLRTGNEGSVFIDAQINVGSGHVDFVADHLALNAMVYAKEASIRPSSNGRSITVGQANCFIEKCLSITNLHRVAAETIGIGYDPLDDYYDDNPSSALRYNNYGESPYYYDYGYAGPIHVAGITNTGRGAISDRNGVTKLIGLLTDSQVTQSGAINVDTLGVLAGGDVQLNHSGNRVSRVFGTAWDGNFTFSNLGQLSIGAPSGFDFLSDILGIWASGNITVSNVGHLIVDSNAIVWAGSGAISMIAHSPLTVNGTVLAGAGPIRLEAASSGSRTDVLTINGTVLSTEGKIDLVAGAGIVINGYVEGTEVSQKVGQTSLQSTQASETVNGVMTAVVQATRAVADMTRPDDTLFAPVDKEEKKEEKTAAADKNDGAKKNDSGKKLYCN